MKNRKKCRIYCTDCKENECMAWIEESGKGDCILNIKDRFTIRMLNTINQAINLWTKASMIGKK